MASLDFENAKEKGIVAPFASDFMAFDSVNGRDSINFKKTAENLAMDAALNNNVGLPAAFYQYISPEIVPVLFAPNNATKLARETKYGDFTTEFMQFPVEEIVGGVQPYSDYDDAVSTDVNYNFPVRENFRFQTTIKFGDLEAEKAAVAKIQLAARKQKAAAAIIAKASNRFYLFGVAGKQTYGLLNDPNLNSAISPVADSQSATTWAAKTAADPTAAANIVFADINKLVAELSRTAGGHFDANSPMVLGISNEMAPYLNLASQFGVTARQLIKETYPNMEVVQIPELSTVSGEELYLTMGEVDGIAVAETAYSEKYRLGRLIPETSSFKQKASGATFGGVVKMPAFIATMTGIA